jgi:hypothetical protein
MGGTLSTRASRRSVRFANIVGKVPTRAEPARSRAGSSIESRERSALRRALYTRTSQRSYPVTNDHPELHVRGEEETTFQADILAKWLIMLPQVAVRHFQLEPNFNDGDGVGKNVRSIAVFMHGSGGLVWGNVRLCRILAGFGCASPGPTLPASGCCRGPSSRSVCPWVWWWWCLVPLLGPLAFLTRRSAAHDAFSSGVVFMPE